MTTALTESITEFASLVQQGIDAWTRAGEILVHLIDTDPSIRETIGQTHPQITPEILARFEAIGRRQLHPATLINNSPGIRRLRRLSYSQQTQYLTERVSMLVRTTDGSYETLQVHVKDLTTKQASQVINVRDGTIRDLGAQRAYLAEHEPFTSPTPALPAYSVRNGKVVITGPCQFTARDLTTLLAQLT